MRHVSKQSLKIAVRRRYGGVCIVRKTDNPDTAHIFPASIYPAIKLYDEVAIPLDRIVHNIDKDCFDKDSNGYTRPPHERVKWIKDKIDPDYISIFREQMKKLLILLRDKDMKYTLFEIEVNKDR